MGFAPLGMIVSETVSVPATDCTLYSVYRIHDLYTYILIENMIFRNNSLHQPVFDVLIL